VASVSMPDYLGAGIILDDNDETRRFAREIIEKLTQEPKDQDTLMNIARETYETDRHAEVFGNKKIREMKKANLIWENHGQYRITTSGRKAYEKAFEGKLPEKDSITDKLLVGGKYRTSSDVQ